MLFLDLQLKDQERFLDILPLSPDQRQDLAPGQVNSLYFPIKF